jgi:hypothetical protein
MSSQDLIQCATEVKIGNATVCSDKDVWMSIDRISEVVKIPSRVIYENCPSARQFRLRHADNISRCFATLADVKAFYEAFNVKNKDILLSELLHIADTNRLMFAYPSHWILNTSLSE